MSKAKICGLSAESDIIAANEAMPDYIGFVFAKSTRQVSAEKARELKSGLDRRITAVGVFVNESISAIAQLVESETIDAIQLHGTEGDDYIKRLRSVCDAEIIRAYPVASNVAGINTSADYCLFDTAARGVYGGTGIAFDWGFLKSYKGPAYFLAGGLNSENVALAIKTLSPFCVDVSSGVEKNGAKDKEMILQFVEAVRKAG
ncbi:MAG: phosphoribosylanthranilate isomerase [Eubacteriaceae bacterium]|nr:phosphoribosylanthranilate isomerase [Eubacteriaceae bacterium]